MENQFDQDKINLGELINHYQISDPLTLQNYLSTIFSDLAKRSKEPEKGIEKLTFNKYYELPGIISDRLFSVLDRDKNEFLNHAEFVLGMKTLFARGETFNSLAKFIFKIYDFNNDGIINKEDVKLILSYVPLNKRQSNKNISGIVTEEFKDRIQSQNELVNILQIAFEKKETLSFEEYISLIEKINSDIFILILTFLLEKSPITKDTIKLFVLNEKLSPEEIKIRTPKALSYMIASPSMDSRFMSPDLKKRTIINKKHNILLQYTVSNNTEQKKFNFSRKNKEFEENKEIDIKNKKLEKENKPIRKYGKNLKYLIDIIPTTNDFTLNKHSENMNDDFLSIPYMEEEEDRELLIDEDKKPIIKHEGYMIKLSNEKKIKKIYFRLIGRDLYYFKKKEDTEHKGVHNLSGIYMEEGKITKIDNKKYYCFSILFPRKTRTYYFENEIDYKTWLTQLKLAIEYKSLLEKYDVKQKIGRGKFGLVKYGINKKTKREVAIKIMSKKTMEPSDFELAKTEIDILKISQHPNIIKIYDVFETVDYIYIVMEYCSGGDLLSYITKRNYKLSEQHTCEIIHKLCMAIYYIHSYGIVHRDLKPSNILMTDNSEKSDIRLLDFGLSKISGSNQKCTEPYGTLAFAAPEILLGKPYDKSVDLWSIGIITFFLLCGYLPFYDQYSEREIARQTIQDSVPFDSKIWNNLSSEAMKFVNGLLKKNPEKRLTITQVLEHPWIKKFSKIPDKRIKCDNEKTFSAYVQL